MRSNAYTVTWDYVSCELVNGLLVKTKGKATKFPTREEAEMAIQTTLRHLRGGVVSNVMNRRTHHNGFAIVKVR